MNRKYKKIPRQLTAEDKEFIKLISAGVKPTKAFKIAFPNHQAVKRYMDLKDRNVSGEGLDMIRRARELITMAAKNKLQTKYMQSAIMTYQDSMERFSELSVDTAIDLVQNARSEKVRADLAIEGIRHKVGTPVQKIASQEEKTIVIKFGDDRKVIDAEDI